MLSSNNYVVNGYMSNRTPEQREREILEVNIINYYISDLHFFCKSELRNGYFKERPFDTLEEMHETIKRNWN